MLKIITQLWVLPLYCKFMCSCSFLLLALFGLIVKILPMPFFLFYFGSYHGTLKMSIVLNDKQKNLALNIGRMIRLTAKYIPWNCTCLPQALVAIFWCKLLNIPYVFYIGLCRGSIEKKNNYLSHAWLMSGPYALTGGNCLNSHNVISTYSSLSKNVF